MAPGNDDSLFLLLPPNESQNGGGENDLHRFVLDARALKLAVIPNLKEDQDSITHAGESLWWSRSKRGAEKWVHAKILNPNKKTVSTQKASKLLSEKVRAVKRFQPGAMDPSKPRHEVILQSLKISHDCPELFVKFYGWYENYPGGDVFFSIFYYKDGDLENYKLNDCGGKPIAQGPVLNVARQLLSAVFYLHEKGIFNLDLRPKHILIADKKSLSVRITNFGIWSGKPHGGHPVYQDRFKAPELVKPGYAKITRAVDLWAIGCIIHEMLHWHTPFVVVGQGFRDGLGEFIKSAFTPNGNWANPPGIRDLLPEFITKGTITLEYQALQEVGFKLTDRAVCFLKRIFVLNPAQRISIKEALEDLWVFSARVFHKQLRKIGINVDFTRAENFLATYDPDDYFLRGTGLVSVLLTDEQKSDIGTLVFRSVTEGFIPLTEMLLDVYRESQRSGGLHRPVLQYFRVDQRIPGVVERSIRLQSFLQRAAGLGNIRMVESLLKKNAAKVNEPHVPSYHNDMIKIIGRTALQAAAENGHIEMVKLLIKKGADVLNDKPCIQSGRTALQGAAENGHLSVVKFLLENGADPNQIQAEFKGCKAIDAAKVRGDREIFKLLLDYGAQDGGSLEAGPEEEIHFEEICLEDAVQPVDLF